MILPIRSLLLFAILADTVHPAMLFFLLLLFSGLGYLPGIQEWFLAISPRTGDIIIGAWVFWLFLKALYFKYKDGL